MRANQYVLKVSSRKNEYVGQISGRKNKKMITVAGTVSALKFENQKMADKFIQKHQMERFLVAELLSGLPSNGPFGDLEDFLRGNIDG